MTSFKKCPIDGYDMYKTNEVDYEGGGVLSYWCCRGCGFVAIFDLGYIKGLVKKK